jgi:xanthine dehydrogenase accessory factor
VTALDNFLTRLAGQPAVLVTVQAHRGSVPREAGAWMAVFAQDAVGTIGGGHLEFQAMAHARQCLSGAAGEATVRYALGPSLGQCCGGDVQVRFELVSVVDTAHLAVRLQPQRTPVALFGGGHVGHALVQVLMNLPLHITWVDSRDEVFPTDLPAQVVCEHSDPVQASVSALRPDSRVLIMSFSHAEDLDVVAACLTRQRQQQDLPFIGLIGSRTKWATFQHRLAARGFTPPELAQVTCPIGIAGVTGKQPETIAVAVAAQILQTLSSESGNSLKPRAGRTAL